MPKNYSNTIQIGSQNPDGLHRTVKSSLHVQSQVVEEALIEFFEKHGVKIEV